MIAVKPRGKTPVAFCIWVKSSFPGPTPIPGTDLLTQGLLKYNNEQGWTSVPEGNQEELLASARRFDQAFHEARKRMFEELLEGLRHHV